MNYPKISIVTPSFNQGKYLDETILSIVGQKYPNLEYIIIDGGSTDNSVEIIRKYEKYLSYWVSEKDKGQSDAINKGLKHITGDLFNWINSDDLLEEGALFKLANAYTNNPDKKVFCFGLNYLKGRKKERFNLENDPKDRLQCFCDPVIAQPATFYSVDAVKQFGQVNFLLHYSMDYEWWLKFMFLYGEKSIFSNGETIASFRIHEEAKTSQGNQNFVNDMAGILYSLCTKVKLEKYMNVLSEVFAVNKKYEFEIPSDKIDTKTVEHMVIYFLLKWKANVYTKPDFLSAKLILKKIDFNGIDLTKKEKEWLGKMEENARPATWLQFRAKRKINHIVSK